MELVLVKAELFLDQLLLLLQVGVGHVSGSNVHTQRVHIVLVRLLRQHFVKSLNDQLGLNVLRRVSAQLPLSLAQKSLHTQDEAGQVAVGRQTG